MGLSRRQLVGLGAMAATSAMTAGASGQDSNPKRCNRLML